MDVLHGALPGGLESGPLLATVGLVTGGGGARSRRASGEQAAGPREGMTAAGIQDTATSPPRRTSRAREQVPRTHGLPSAHHTGRRGG